MRSIVIDPKCEGQVTEGNGTDIGALKGRLAPEDRNSLVGHPLWEAFLAELQASRQADKVAAALEWSEAASAE